MPLIDYSRPVQTPRRSDINSGLTSLRPATLRAAFGYPRKSLSTQCQPITNRDLVRRIITDDVGPFRVTGLDIAVRSLRRVMVKIFERHVQLYHQLGSAGMLCCRVVRGTTSLPSSHAWGTAIDLRFNGQLDTPGDRMTQEGLLLAYRCFHEEGWYWGAGFKREDSMHFELAEETFLHLNSRR